MKIRSGYWVQFLLLALLAGASGALGQTNINMGTTGVAWVFANGVMDWNTFQFKPLVHVTRHHLGQYDTNGNSTVNRKQSDMRVGVCWTET